ncbi:capsular polysaccharide biosynthesis protein [Bacteroidia bacterium]|nr:capsular polysaccharide biosynthesis protein [Bacteroidia bacterium]
MNRNFLFDVSVILAMLMTLLLFHSAQFPIVTHEPPAQTSDAAATTDSIRIIIAGDLMGHGMQISGAWHDGGDSSYNYHPVFQHVKEYLSAADLALANLEVTLAGAPYTGFPKFSTHQSFAAALQDAGFDALVTANNHALDRGKQGLERTIDVLDSLGIAHTGTFKDSVAWKSDYPLILTSKNFRIALLNYTYGTNGIAVERPNVINRIDTLRMAADLAKARAMQPDFIITCIHWGEEYQNNENAAQRRVARFLARNGCNLIAGAHPHVVQPFAKIPVAGKDSMPVIYSMGNFVSNQRDRYRYGGITLDVTLVKTDSTVRIASYGYEPFWVHRFRDNKVSVFRLIPVNDYLQHPENYTISDENKKMMMQFYDDTQALLPSFN